MPVLSRYKPLEVGGITFLVTRNWGAVKWAQRRLREAGVGEGGSDEAALAVIDEVLLRLVQGWEGVTDDNGDPMAWGPEALDALDPDAVTALMQALLGNAEGESGKGLTSTAPGAPSGRGIS